jgi:hypothetical protein
MLQQANLQLVQLLAFVFQLLAAVELLQLPAPSLSFV